MARALQVTSTKVYKVDLPLLEAIGAHLEKEQRVRMNREHLIGRAIRALAREVGVSIPEKLQAPV